MQSRFAFLPYRTAAECIDWTLPCPSIFERRKPLAEATLRRIATGIRRYVIEAESPFIVSLTHQGGDGRSYGVGEPFSIITGAHRGEQALVTPYVVRTGSPNSQSVERGLDEPFRTVMPHPNEALITPYLLRTAYKQANGSYVNDMRDPYPTVTAQADGASVVAPYVVRMNHDGAAKPASSVADPLDTLTTQSNKHNLLAATLVQTGYGERDGQAPRALDLEAPLGTVVGGGAKHALVSAFLAKHYGGHETPGAPLDEAMPTVTATDHNALTAAHLLKLYGTSSAASLEDAMPTVTGQGQHLAEVRAFLVKYYGNDKDGQGLQDPLHTVTSKERFALGVVHIAGEPYQIVDIGMRMLSPRELYRAQGFPDDYIIDLPFNGRPLTKTAQIRMCGNSVCPPAAEAIVRANLGSTAGTRVELAEVAS